MDAHDIPGLLMLVCVLVGGPLLYIVARVSHDDNISFWESVKKCFNNLILGLIALVIVVIAIIGICTIAGMVVAVPVNTVLIIYLLARLSQDKN